MHKVHFPMQYYSFLLDLAACCSFAHCLSIQNISQYPFHSPEAPQMLFFFNWSIPYTPRNRHQGTFSTGDLAKAHFHFFLQTQTSGKVITYKKKKYLGYGVNPFVGFWTPNFFLPIPQALSHTTHFAWNVLPWLPNSDLSFRSQLRWNFLHKDFPNLSPSS